MCVSPQSQLICSTKETLLHIRVLFILEVVRLSEVFIMCVCVCVCVCVLLSMYLIFFRVFGHFDTPLFLELCKSFQTLHLFKGQKLFSIGKLLCLCL